MFLNGLEQFTKVTLSEATAAGLLVDFQFLFALAFYPTPYSLYDFKEERWSVSDWFRKHLKEDALFICISKDTK